MHVSTTTLLLGGATVACVASGLVSALATPWVIRAARRLGLLDAPNRGRHVHTEAVPRLGGIAVMLGWAAAMLLVEGVTDIPPLDPAMYAAFAGAATLFLVGVVDDVRGTSPKLKVAAQVFAGVLLWRAGFQPGVVRGLWGSDVALGALGLPLLIVWVVFITNAYNLIDGINGLAGSVGVLAAVALGVTAGYHDRPHSLVALAAVAGALVGLLPFNYPRARIFLGDAGSMPVGFLLAYLSLRGARTPGDSVVLAVVPVTALALPIVDATLAILRRWLRGGAISGADARHIHHRLLALGFSHVRATAALAAVAASFAVLGVAAVVLAGPAALAIVLAGAAAAALLLAVGSQLLSYHEFAVALRMVWTGPGRARVVVRDEIHAVDMVERLAGVRDWCALNRLMADAGTKFGFLHMEVVREQPASRRRLTSNFRRLATRAWRVDFLLHASTYSPGRGASLVIWCDHAGGADVRGAERVARLLAPALEAWMARHDGSVPDLAAEPPLRLLKAAAG